MGRREAHGRISGAAGLGAAVAIAAALGGCAKAVTISPAQLPQVTRDAAAPDAEVRVTGLGPRGRPVDVEGRLETVAVTTKDPARPRELFAAPVRAHLAGAHLTIEGAERRAAYSMAEISAVQVEVEDLAARRTGATVLIALGALSLAGATTAAVYAATAKEEYVQAVIGAGLAVPLGATSLGLLIPGVALTF